MELDKRNKIVLHDPGCTNVFCINEFSAYNETQHGGHSLYQLPFRASAGFLVQFYNFVFLSPASTRQLNITGLLSAHLGLLLQLMAVNDTVNLGGICLFRPEVGVLEMKRCG